MNNKFLSIAVFTGLFLFMACGGNNGSNDKVGTELDCKESGWLSNPALIGALNYVSNYQSTSTDSSNSQLAPVTGTPLTVTEGVLNRIAMEPQNENSTKNTGIDISMIEGFGYDGNYGGFLSFTPKEDGSYRIYGNEGIWFIIKDEAGKNVFAERFIGNCVTEQNKKVRIIVEFPLKKGKTYSIQLLNSKAKVFYFYIYKGE